MSIIQLLVERRLLAEPMKSSAQVRVKPEIVGGAAQTAERRERMVESFLKADISSPTDAYAFRSTTSLPTHSNTSSGSSSAPVLNSNSAHPNRRSVLY